MVKVTLALRGARGAVRLISAEVVEGDLGGYEACTRCGLTGTKTEPCWLLLWLWLLLLLLSLLLLLLLPNAYSPWLAAFALAPSVGIGSVVVPTPGSSRMSCSRELGLTRYFAGD